jgi:predicted dehydrogenase
MKQALSQRKLRAGIVGGGQGSFTGAVHRIACELDGQAEVVAGAMSADPERAAASAQAWFLLRSVESGEPLHGGYPTVSDGLRGMRFIDRVVESSQKGAVWVDF